MHELVGMHVHGWIFASTRLLFNVMQASARNHRLITQLKAAEAYNIFSYSGHRRSKIVKQSRDQ